MLLACLFLAALSGQIRAENGELEKDKDKFFVNIIHCFRVLSYHRVLHPGSGGSDLSGPGSVHAA